MAESLFPFITQAVAEQASSGDLPVLKEYAWDFANDCLLTTDGKVKTVGEAEAVKIWAMKALRTARYRYLAYSWDYGNELEDLIGQGLSREIAGSEATGLVRQALQVNPYVRDIQNVVVNLEGASLKMDCTLLTVYGEVAISV